MANTSTAEIAESAAAVPDMLKLNVAEEPIAMPLVGLPPPNQLPPSAAPLMKEPYGAPEAGPVLIKLAFVQDTNEIPVALTFNSNPVM
jgi:hypothetical protein